MKVLKALIMAVLMLILSAFVSYAAPETKKAIYIVYDDTSGIYYDEAGEFTDKWGVLKNSVKTLAALGNEGDKIVIYPISGGGKGIEFENKNNPSELISKIDKSLTGYSVSRSFKSVFAAYEDLKKESNAYEKWLLVISNGKFEEYKYETSDTSVQEELVSYTKDGIKVISHAISNDGAIYNLKNAENFYCYNAGDLKEIFPKTVEVSNLIYGRKTLTPDYYEYDEKNQRLTIKDISLPMKEVIFITGGTVSGSVGKVGAGGVISVKAPEAVPDVFSDNKDKLKYATGAEKNIYKYKGSSSVQPGEYSLLVSNGMDVIIVFKADVDLQLRLFKNKSRVDEDESISVGQYDYKIVAVNPLTGAEISSPLFDGAVYSVKVNNQGNETSFDQKEGSVSFLKGSTRLEAKLDLGTQKFIVADGFYVFGDADFTLGVPQTYYVKNLSSAEPFKVAVRTESSPENVTLYCRSKKNIKFRVEKGAGSNEFLVYPEHANAKSYLFTDTGEIDVVFTAVINENGETMTYSRNGKFVVCDINIFVRILDWILYYKWVVLSIVAVSFVGGVSVNILLRKRKEEKQEEEE